MDYLSDKRFITITREDGDFKTYFDMLEEHIIPTISNKSMDGRKLPKEVTFYYFNDNWKHENLAEIVSLYPILNRLDTKETTPLLDGCTLDQTQKILAALISTYDCFMLEVAGSPKTKKGYDVKERYFDTLYNLAFNSDVHINVSDASDTVTVKKIIKGAAKGGIMSKKNRQEIRDRLVSKIKAHIAEKYMWNNATNTITSITEELWQDIQESVKNTGEWQGVQIDFQKSKIGRQTIYNAVSETSPY